MISPLLKAAECLRAVGMGCWKSWEAKERKCRTCSHRRRTRVIRKACTQETRWKLSPLVVCCFTV